MALVVCAILLILALIIPAATARVSASLDHESFEKCWNKELAKIGVSESLMGNSIKSSTERQAMSGNTTTDEMRPSSTDPANPFIEGIRDCMLMD